MGTKRGRKKRSSTLTSNNKKAVSSKIEHTKSNAQLQYRNKVRELGVAVADYIRSKTDNLLTAKLALWEGIRLIEEELRCRRD